VASPSKRRMISDSTINIPDLRQTSQYAFTSTDRGGCRTDPGRRFFNFAT
jgi:hypothetical protein